MSTGVTMHSSLNRVDNMALTSWSVGGKLKPIRMSSAASDQRLRTRLLHTTVIARYRRKWGEPCVAAARDLA